MKIIAAALAGALLFASTAAAQGGFSFAAFERDPSAYSGAPSELRANLEAAGFQCRDAYPSEQNLAASCELTQQTNRHCFAFYTVSIRPAAVAEVVRTPRCMGVINPPPRLAGG
ncbi:MAG: hypothetical protein AB7J28_07165 [Hyphomonadaceae bacterium]